MITDLRLQHYRSYSDEIFEFSNSVNIVVGPNGSGKTNLLEAVLLIARGSSYRAKDSELVQFDEDWSRLDAHLASGGQRTVKLTPDSKPAKTYELDSKAYQRLSLDKTLPIVLFEPDHLRLLSGGPERRRDYLDDLLEQTTAGYGSLRRQYKRTLAQRNALLKKSGGQSKTQIFPWNVRLSELAGQIVKKRYELCQQIDFQAGELYKRLSASSVDIKIEYQNSWAVDAYASHLLKQLDKTWEMDQLRGFTTSGPHREAFRVVYDGHPSQITASRGEIRTIVLGLKIIELKLIEAARDITPMLLLDDVFSELDGRRRHALTDYLAKYQTFITTTDADLVMQNFAIASNVVALT
jgi:DNA replication and repair protein RecF